MEVHQEEEDRPPPRGLSTWQSSGPSGPDICEVDRLGRSVGPCKMYGFLGLFKLRSIFYGFLVFVRFSAKVGPRNLPDGPGLKNAT